MFDVDFLGHEVIWDSYWAFLHPDGSRRIIGYAYKKHDGQQLADDNPELVEASKGEIYLALGNEGILFPYNDGFRRNHIWPDSPFYLSYDHTEVHRESVNPIPDLLNWRAHAARFSHELDAVMGHRTSSAVSENEREATWTTFKYMIGSCWKFYKRYEIVSPTLMNSHQEFVWKTKQDGYLYYDQVLCGHCNVSTYGRRFMRHANIEEFRRVHMQGGVYAVNQDVTPWMPIGPFDHATTYGLGSQEEMDEAISDFYGNLEENFQEAIDYYDFIVGPPGIRYPGDRGLAV